MTTITGYERRSRNFVRIDQGPMVSVVSRIQLEDSKRWLASPRSTGKIAIGGLRLDESQVDTALGILDAPWGVAS